MRKAGALSMAILLPCMAKGGGRGGSIEEARDEIARLIGASPGGDLLHLREAPRPMPWRSSAAPAGRRGRAVGRAPSTLRCGRPSTALRPGGSETVVVDPEPSGRSDPARVVEAARPGDARSSRSWPPTTSTAASFPIARLAAAVRARGALFHTDAVQAAGPDPDRRRGLGCGPADRSPRTSSTAPRAPARSTSRAGVPLQAHTPGGGQEKKLRGGHREHRRHRGLRRRGPAGPRAARGGRAGSRRLRDRLENGILGASSSGARVVGAGAPRLPNTSALLFEGLSGEALLIRLDLEGVAVSVGSACSSGTLAPSPAILSLGLPPAEAKSVVRFSLSRLTTRGGDRPRPRDRLARRRRGPESPESVVHGTEGRQLISPVRFRARPAHVQSSSMRIAVAMSGGVDSSVAALLLKEEGHEVVGLSMQLWDHSGEAGRTGRCCTLDDLSDARRVAWALGHPALRPEPRGGVPRRRRPALRRVVPRRRDADPLLRPATRR